MEKVEIKTEDTEQKAFQAPLYPTRGKAGQTVHELGRVLAKLRWRNTVIWESSFRLYGSLR